jgi:hypothetical protein
MSGSGSDGSTTPRGRRSETPSGLELFASIARRTDNSADDIKNQGQMINTFLKDVTGGDESVRVDYSVRETERRTRFILTPSSLTYYNALVAAARTKLKFPYRIEQSQTEGRDRSVNSLRQLDDGLPTVVVVRDTLFKHFTPERILFLKLGFASVVFIIFIRILYYLFALLEHRR